MAKRMPRRRRAKRTGGKNSQNTKTDERVTLRVVQDIRAVGSTANNVGSYVWVAYSPQNTAYFNITSSTEFTARKALYDEFKISYMKISFRPSVNEVISAQGTGATAAFFSPDVYTFIDRDGNAPISTSLNIPAKLQEYASCRIHKWTRSWTRTLKTNTFWCNTNYPVANTNEPEFQPWINKGVMGMVGVYAQYLQVPPTNLLGQITVTYGVQFRGKKPTAFGYDPVSGTVLVTPIECYPLIVPQNKVLAAERADQYLNGDGEIVSLRDGQLAKLGPTGNAGYAQLLSGPTGL